MLARLVLLVMKMCCQVDSEQRSGSFLFFGKQREAEGGVEFTLRKGDVSVWHSGAVISREQRIENRRKSANKRLSAKMAARKEETFQVNVGPRRYGKWRKLKMELETLETTDEGREYEVETDERREDGGGADDEHVTGDGE